MHTFYYSNHSNHDPAQLHHPDLQFTNVYYSEIAQRGVLIHDEIKHAKLGPIIAPGEFGIEPILEVHENEMVNLLKNAYQQLNIDDSRRSVIPETFNVDGGRKHRPYSVWGLLGMYAFDTSSPLFENTWEVAYWSAQTALSAAALVLAGGEQVAYALCRPPGHHAMRNKFGGFCYLNNVAIAANWLAQQGHRVAILDIDYHHGNGTQDIFYGRSDVLFCSIHADPLNEYPYYWGYADEYGTSAGVNYNFNFPLPLSCKELEYMTAFDEALHKIRQYVPDILLVSLGVDIIEGDPVGGFNMTTSTLARLGAKIAAFDLPTIVLQEGGYHLPTLGKNVVTFLKGILGSS
jgi:acetoin utilization deacetylase AcuC-like enzyme